MSSTHLKPDERNNEIASNNASLKHGIYTGHDIKKLPEMRSSLVKIFLSSTFTGNNYIF